MEIILKSAKNNSTYIKLSATHGGAYRVSVYDICGGLIGYPHTVRTYGTEAAAMRYYRTQVKKYGA